MARTLTVVTPSYNQGEFLERTIESVLSQGWDDLEYVIVDGGSTDDSVEIIRRYERHLAWWVSEPDAGQSAAINRGIAQTGGEVVAYVNSDDYYLPGAFEAAMAALDANPEAGWVAGGALDIEEGETPHLLRVWRPKPPPYCEGRLKGRHWWMLVPWHVPQPSSFWRRDLFERHGLFREDMHYAFDAELMLRLAYAGEPPLLLAHEFLSVRSVHPSQKTYDMTNSWPEIHRFVAIFAPQLSGRERMRMRLTRPFDFALRTGGRTRNALRKWLVVPAMWLYGRALRLGGDALEYVPERVRPRIRHRDRRGPARNGAADKRRAPSPIGLELVEFDPGPAPPPAVLGHTSRRPSEDATRT
ncbi:MAG: glycosyltransferase family 2 protein [Solirubrobacterales bacterium]